MADWNIFGSAPDYLGGLLGQQALEDLQKKALTTGLINTAIGYIAQPKNQRFGSALPYIGRALQAGQTAAQGVYDQGLKNWEMQQKLEQLNAQKEAVARVSATNPELANVLKAYPTAASGVLERVYTAKETKPTGKLLTKEEAVLQGLPTDQGQRWQQKPDQTFEIVSGTAPAKETGLTELDKLIAKRNEIAIKNPNDPTLKIYDAKIRKETEPSAGVTVNYGAPVAGYDASGNPVFFQPSKGGGAPAIIPGVTPPPKEEKPATEAQAKAGAFANQMSSATDELNRLKNEGYDPSSIKAQAATSVAGTPLTLLTDPKSQQANQAQQQWAEAYLRFKTGAAATEGEVIRNMRTFFPQIGDKPETIAQKARMRKQAEADVRGAAKQPTTTVKPVQQQRTRTDAEILKQYGL